MWVYLINDGVGVARACMKIYIARIRIGWERRKKTERLKMYNEKMELLLHRRQSSVTKLPTHKKDFTFCILLPVI